MHHPILKNLLSLSALQAANYLIPLFTVPYIVRIVGPEFFGLISFAQAFVIYFTIVVNYGFDLSATRQISVNRGNQEKISSIVSSVLSAKFLLFVLSTIIFLALTFLIPKFEEHLSIYIVSYLFLIGTICFPTWLFQGMENLTQLAFFNFFIRIIYTIFIFLFLQFKEQYLLVPLSNSAAQVIISFISIGYAISYYKILFNIPSKREIWNQFKDGWSIFISTIAINIYTTSNVFILGFFASNESVGYFSGASKIIIVIQALFLYPFNQTYYPYLNILFSESKEKGIHQLKYLVKIFGSCTLIISVVTFIAAPLIILILLGDKFSTAVVPLRILAFLPFIIGLSNIFGIQGMLNLKLDRQFSKMIATGSFLSLILNFILAPLFAEIGTAIAWLITEIFITITAYYILTRLGIRLLPSIYSKKII